MGAAGFESEAENATTGEKVADSGSEAVVETPTGDRSRGPEADLAHAMKLAAEAGQWGIVADLSRQLDAVRQRWDRRGRGLAPTDHKLVHGDRSEEPQEREIRPEGLRSLPFTGFPPSRA